MSFYVKDEWWHGSNPFRPVTADDIDEAMVERAACAAYNVAGAVRWTDADEHDKRAWRSEARAALTAALVAEKDGKE